MPKILVHVHLYYQEMWPELKACLQNITAEYDLFVTMVEDKAELRADILAFSPEAKINIVPNKGFDIAPFIDVLNKVDLTKYDYIIKLHTKRDMPKGTLRNGFDVSGNKWREYLLTFLRNQKTFEKCLSAFSQDKTLGMIADYHLIVKNDRKNEEAVRKAQELLTSLKLQTKDNRYVMGTMFMARAKLFEPIKKLNLNFDDFSSSVRGEDILPYALECLLGYVVCVQAYKILDPLHVFLYQSFAKIFAKISTFIYRKKIKSDGQTIIKICKVPLLSIVKMKKEEKINAGC